eukprot:COSAG05_NODE_427_length_9894_cov_159.048596_4_plen_96_part_00
MFSTIQHHAGSDTHLHKFSWLGHQTVVSLLVLEGGGARLDRRLGITVPQQSPAPIAPAPAELVPVDWSNDSDESEEEEEIQEERARAMDECEDEN